DCFGLTLVNETTGEIARTQDNSWEPRYQALYRYPPWQAMRITRVLKSFGDLGMEHYQRNLLEFLIQEMLESPYRLGESEYLLKSLVDYWVGTVRDENERRRLERCVLANLRRIQREQNQPQ